MKDELTSRRINGAVYLSLSSCPPGAITTSWWKTNVKQGHPELAKPQQIHLEAHLIARHLMNTDGDYEENSPQCRWLADHKRTCDDLMRAAKEGILPGLKRISHASKKRNTANEGTLPGVIRTNPGSKKRNTTWSVPLLVRLIRCWTHD